MNNGFKTGYLCGYLRKQAQSPLDLMRLDPEAQSIGASGFGGQTGGVLGESAKDKPGNRLQESVSLPPDPSAYEKAWEYIKAHPYEFGIGGGAAAGAGIGAAVSPKGRRLLGAGIGTGTGAVAGALAARLLKKKAQDEGRTQWKDLKRENLLTWLPGGKEGIPDRALNNFDWRYLVPFYGPAVAAREAAAPPPAPAAAPAAAPKADPSLLQQALPYAYGAGAGAAVGAGAGAGIAGKGRRLKGAGIGAGVGLAAGPAAVLLAKKVQEWRDKKPAPTDKK